MYKVNKSEGITRRGRSNLWIYEGKSEAGWSTICNKSYSVVTGLGLILYFYDSG